MVDEGERASQQESVLTDAEGYLVKCPDCVAFIPREHPRDFVCSSCLSEAQFMDLELNGYEYDEHHGAWKRSDDDE